MGLGWVQNNNRYSYCTFKAAFQDWPSSTRAELAALITAKYGSEIQICCDSSAIIQGYDKNVVNNNINIHKLLKENNYMLWTVVEYIIKKLNLIKFTVFIIQIFIQKINGVSSQSKDNQH